MTHESEGTVIHKVKHALTAPIPGGGKWWHVIVLCALCFGLGKWL